MKSNLFKTSALLLLVVLSATVIGVARGGRHHYRGHGPGRREVQAYFQANILPVLRQQRLKLEPQLAEADRAQLAAYRIQLKALKEQGQALRRSRPSGGEAPASLSDAQREQAHQLRTQAHGIMLNVAQMAQKYDSPITELTREVQPQKEKWAADITAIVARNATPEQQQRLAAFGERRRGPGGMRGPGSMQRYFKPASFLLMDPAAAPGTERSIGSSSFYPNPATAITQLEYDVKKAGPVSIELLDKNGSVLRTLVSEPQAEKGAHTRQLDLSDLPAGTYFYKIATKGGSETKRFVKE